MKIGNVLFKNKGRYLVVLGHKRLNELNADGTRSCGCGTCSRFYSAVSQNCCSIYSFLTE
jgi:hypothetical protein